MSPEQMRGQPIDHRVDVYSMGITLYEVLSGVRPFDAGSYGDLLLKVAEAQPPPLARLVPDLPSGLIDVVSRAMSYDREARFSSMMKLASALEPYIERGGSLLPTSPASWGGQSGDTPWASETSALSESVGSRALAMPPKSRTRWVVLGIGVLVGAVLLALFLSQGPRDQAGNANRDGTMPDGSTATTAVNGVLAAPPIAGAGSGVGPVHGHSQGHGQDSAEPHQLEPAGSQPPPTAATGDELVPLPAAVPSERPLTRRLRSARSVPAESEPEPARAAPGSRPERTNDSERQSNPSSRTRPRNRAPATMDRSDF
jgi:hypothetical protein